jgi:hypothetical protein
MYMSMASSRNPPNANEVSVAGLEIYRDLREKWVHEDELVNHRVTWLLTSQAFSLSAFGILVKLRLDWCASHPAFDMLAAQVEPWSLAEMMTPILSALILSGLGRGIDAAFDAMKEIKYQLSRYQAANLVWIGAAVEIAPATTKKGASAALHLVRTFWTAWGSIYVYELLRLLNVLR